MFPAQHQSPSACSFMPPLTLASINARQPELSTTAYSKSWMPDYSFDLGIPLFQPHDFQSNSTHLQFETSTPPGNRTGLGIQYPDSSLDFKLSFSPINSQSDLHDAFPYFSPRLEASYSNGTTFENGDNSLDHSSWSLSMLYAEMQQGSSEGTSTRGSEPSTDVSLRESSTAEDLSLESLSAAAGLSVEEFTDKITEGAKYALKKVADFEHAGSLPSGQNLYSQLDPGVTLPAFSEISALDVDMSDTWFPSCLGVNPADVMPRPSLLPTDMFSVLGHRMRLEDVALDPPPAPELLYPGTPPAHIVGFNQPQRRRSTPQAREDGEQLSDYEPPAFLSPSSSEYSPSLGSSRPYHTRASRIKKRKIPLCDTLEFNSVPIPAPLSESNSLPPIDLGSPVFDAHRGIEIEELKSRAERYRLRNQGRDYDKRWLLSYAGKLSTKGELLEEFRCYITGCQQVNKRRDHILIHVGAHLDQRPFKCVHCSARFLRKNECKRHELSHTGIRPFTCHLCAFPATTFVRQDLLRRHMKRTHQVDDEKENKGSSSRPRKKARKI